MRRSHSILEARCLPQPPAQITYPFLFGVFAALSLTFGGHAAGAQESAPVTDHGGAVPSLADSSGGRYAAVDVGPAGRDSYTGYGRVSFIRSVR